MYCQSGQMERAAERPGGTGKKVKHEAGDTSIERKTRNIEKQDGRQARVAEQSKRKIS